MPDIAQELRHATRRLRRAPAFTTTSVFVLALGLGAATTMFAILYGVVLRALPYPNADRLVDVSHSIAVSGVSKVQESDGTFMLYQRHNSVFSSMGAVRPMSVNLGPLLGGGGSQDAERIAAAGVTATLFPTLGVSTERGHAFTADEDRPSAPRVIILSHALWQQKYGSDPAIVGKRISIDGVPCEVVGIMPASFQYPSSAIRLWVPLQFDAAHAEPLSFNYNVVARLKAGVTAQMAAADLARSTPRLLDEFPSNVPKIGRAHV